MAPTTPPPGTWRYGCYGYALRRADTDAAFGAASQAMRRQAELELKLLKQKEAEPHARSGAALKE